MAINTNKTNGAMHSQQQQTPKISNLNKQMKTNHKNKQLQIQPPKNKQNKAHTNTNKPQ